MQALPDENKYAILVEVRKQF